MNKPALDNNVIKKRFSNFFQDKRNFYSKSELKFDDRVVVLLSLSFLVYAFTGVFINSSFLIVWSIIFWILSFLTIIAFFSNKKNHPLTTNFLPFIMFFISLIFIEILWLLINNENFSKFFLTNFSFLFSDAVNEDITKYFNGEKIKDANIQNAKKIFLNFSVGLLRTVFLLIFLKINFINIKKKMQDLNKNPLRILTFFFVLVFFYTIIFQALSSQSAKSLFFTALEKDSSENQKNIDEFRNASSTLILPLLSTVLIAPFWEEFIYRFLIFKILGRKRLFLAALLSILVFAFIHIHANDFKNESFLTAFFSTKILTYFWGGFIAVLIYYNYNLNLFFPIFWHAFHNFRVYNLDLDAISSF